MTGENGVLEYWNNGMMENTGMPLSITQYSNVPSLHFEP
jgi:hypothetical protein